MTIQQKQQILIFMMGDLIRLGILCLSFFFFSQYSIHCPNYSYYCDDDKKDDGYEVRCIATQNDYTRSEARYELWGDGTEFVVYTKYYDDRDDIPDPLYSANGRKVSMDDISGIRTLDGNFYQPCIVLGLILLTIFIFIRFIYDIFYIIRLYSDYQSCRFLEILDTFRIIFSILTITFEGFATSFCSLLYLSKFDEEGFKTVKSSNSWNVDNASRALIITASVFLPLQIISLVIGKIVEMDDCGWEPFPYSYLYSISTFHSIKYYIITHCLW